MTDKLIQINQLNQNNKLQNLDLSDGFVCDVETGICGPLDEINKRKEQESEKEKKNANNSLV